MASVVIPTKDEEKIFKAIERADAEDPEEIIVVNDSESSESYKERIQKIDSIKYVEVEGGTAEARNRGAEEASSDIILFLDADCYPVEGWKDKMSKALENTDIAEGEVEYIGKRTPFSRIVENRGEKGRYLTANLGVRKEVFDQVQFDENYAIFREDTDFGISAEEKGFKTEFVHAKVEHDAGKRTVNKFIEDQQRYKTEPYFFQKFRENKELEKHLSHLGPVLYPLELIFTGFIAGSLLLTALNPLSISGAVSTSLFLTTYYSFSAIQNKDASFSIKDWFKGLYALPISLFAKRYAIWKGAIHYGVKVI